MSTTRQNTATVSSRPEQHVAPNAQRRTPEPRTTPGRVLRSELIKLLTVRSTYYSVLATVLAIVGIAAFMAIGVTVQEVPVDGEAPPDPTGGALSGVSLAVYLVAALGVLAVTSEYGTGTIKATLAGVPKRPALVVGKALAVSAVTLVATLTSTVSAFFINKAVLSTADVDVSLTDPGVLRAVTGAALYLTAVAVFAGGLGWLLRSTAGSLATLFGILIILPVAAFLLPSGIRGNVLPYLPDSAGMAIMQTTSSPGQLPPWTGFGVFLGYTVATLLAAAILLNRRDA
jgi:ABC-type transport system involved in multi-copper enzyme maturation permease subunit